MKLEEIKTELGEDTFRRLEEKARRRYNMRRQQGATISEEHYVEVEIRNYYHEWRNRK